MYNTVDNSKFILVKKMERALKNEKEIIANIKSNITLLRKANKLSMRDTAFALGVKENTYRVWEDPGKSGPKPQYIYQIAKAYGVTTDFLYSNTSQDIVGAEVFNINDSELEDIEKVSEVCLEHYCDPRHYCIDFIFNI